MPRCEHCEHYVQFGPMFCESCFNEAEARTAVELAADDLLAACKDTLGLPVICEEIGHAGQPHLYENGHALIRTTDGEYVKMHIGGGWPALERIMSKLQAAIAKAKTLD